MVERVISWGGNSLVERLVEGMVWEMTVCEYGGSVRARQAEKGERWVGGRRDHGTVSNED